MATVLFEGSDGEIYGSVEESVKGSGKDGTPRRRKGQLPFSWPWQLGLFGLPW
jgi:hypothetical protein